MWASASVPFFAVKVMTASHLSSALTALSNVTHSANLSFYRNRVFNLSVNPFFSQGDVFKTRLNKRTFVLGS